MDLIISDPIRGKRSTRVNPWKKLSGLGFLKTELNKEVRYKECDPNTEVVTTENFWNCSGFLVNIHNIDSKAQIVFPSHCSAMLWSSNSVGKWHCWQSWSDRSAWPRQQEGTGSRCASAGPDAELELSFDLCITRADCSGCAWVSDLCQAWRDLTNAPWFSISCPTSGCLWQGK